jgi:parallel beta-helix repeat protein
MRAVIRRRDLAKAFVSITDFGAVGDGKSDNRAAIQAAADYAHAHGADVYVPDGTFQHRGVISLNGVVLFGNGASSVLKAVDSLDQAVSLTGDGAALRNLTLDSDANARSARNNSSKVLVVSATHFTIENVTIVNSNSAGILVYDSAHGTIQNNALRYTMADAIQLTAGTNDVVVRANRIDHAGDDGIAVVSYESTGLAHDITITGNQVVNNDWGRNISVVGGEHIQITNNYVSGNAAGLAGIYLATEGAYDTMGVAHVSVTGNTILGTGGAVTGHGNITLYDGTDHSLSDITISGNFVEGNGIRSIGTSIVADLLDNLVNSGGLPPAAPMVPAPAAAASNLILTGSPQADELRGGAGSDTLISGAGDDRLYGSDGPDLVQGNQGADLLYGGGGNDTAFGGQDNDTLYGGDGGDQVLGNLGDDMQYGEAGADTLWGGQQNDTLYGGDGDDFLSGDRNDDVLTGGAGADRFAFTPDGGSDVVSDFSGLDGDRIVVPVGLTVATLVSPAGDAMLLVDGYGTLTLAGIRPEQVDATWFVS